MNSLQQEDERPDVKKEEGEEGEIASPPSHTRLNEQGNAEYHLTLLQHPLYPYSEPNVYEVWCSPDQYIFRRTMFALRDFLLRIPDHDVVREVCATPDAYGVMDLYTAITTLPQEFSQDEFQKLMNRLHAALSTYKPHARRAYAPYGQVAWEREPYIFLVYALLICSLQQERGRYSSGQHMTETLHMAHAYVEYARDLHRRISYVPGLPFDDAYAFVAHHLKGFQWF